jgi:hypothetical protein
MYTSYIGHKFLRLFNQKNRTNFTAADFFEKQMFPLFFDHEKHLMHVSNSPFFQNPAEERLKASGLTKARLQYEDLKQKVNSLRTEDNLLADASIFVGFAAAGPLQTTAGQVTNLKIPSTSEDVYASWIGNALAARVEGSLCLLIESEEVLWDLYSGWSAYRDYLNQTPNLEGRQIETWNGQWLANDDKDFAPNHKDKKLATMPWLKVLLRLTSIHAHQVIPVYVFSLGQTNTTIGFINFHLSSVRRMGDLCTTIIELKDQTAKQFWEVYQEEYSLRDAIKNFAEIGLHALKPKDFAKHLEEKEEQSKITPKNKILFLNSKVWIIAMLNNKKELQELAAELALAFWKTKAQATLRESTKTIDVALVKNALEATTKRKFVEALTDLMEKFPEETMREAARKAVDESMAIPGDLFPLFKTLVRFEYIYLKTAKKNLNQQKMF